MQLKVLDHRLFITQCQAKQVKAASLCKQILSCYHNKANTMIAQARW